MQLVLALLALLLLCLQCTDAFSFNIPSKRLVRNSISQQISLKNQMINSQKLAQRTKLHVTENEQDNFDAINANKNSDKFEISAWLNPNTRGGVIVWCILLTSIPVACYQYFVSTGMESNTVGAYVGAIFVLLSNLLWASTYVFRVANKDMTYAKQLRDYENAVLQKRLEELKDEEIDALMQEIENEK